MDAENDTIDEGSDAHVVEDLHTVTPWVGVAVLPHALMSMTSGAGMTKETVDEA